MIEHGTLGVTKSEPVDQCCIPAASETVRHESGTLSALLCVRGKAGHAPHPSNVSQIAGQTVHERVVEAIPSRQEDSSRGRCGLAQLANGLHCSFSVGFPRG